MRLTDRNFATGVTKQDLIHIVITGDTTDSPEGSSYKAPVGQILELYNLPSPNIQIRSTSLGAGEDVVTLNTGNTVGATINILNPPSITIDNLSEEQLNNYVWIEMVQYKIRNKSKTITQVGSEHFTGGRYVVQPRIDDDGLGNPINWLQERIKNLYGNDKTLTTRGGVMTMESSPFGSPTPLSVNRHNHTEIDITDFNKIVNLSNYLAGRFTYDTVHYLPTVGSITSLPNVPVPTTNRNSNYNSSYARKYKGGNGTSYELCYTGNLTSLYIAFRFIMFDPYSNDGKGKFIEGPLSQTIKVTNKYFPFLNTAVDGKCSVNPQFALSTNNTKIQCSLVNKP